MSKTINKIIQAETKEFINLNLRGIKNLAKVTHASVAIT